MLGDFAAQMATLDATDATAGSNSREGSGGAGFSAAGIRSAGCGVGDPGRGGPGDGPLLEAAEFKGFRAAVLERQQRVKRETDQAATAAAAAAAFNGAQGERGSALVMASPASPFVARIKSIGLAAEAGRPASSSSTPTSLSLAMGRRQAHGGRSGGRSGSGCGPLVARQATDNDNDEYTDDEDGNSGGALRTSSWAEAIPMEVALYLKTSASFDCSYRPE